MDISDYSDPHLAYTFDAGYYGMYRDGIYLYLSNYGNTVLKIYDVSDNRLPVLMGSYVQGSALGRIKHMVKDGDILYCLAGIAEGSGVLVLNVSDPEDPVRVSFYETESSLSLEGIFFDESYLYISCDRWVEVLDKSDPASLTRVGIYGKPGHLLGFDFIGSVGSNWVVLCEGDRFWIADITDKTAMIRTAHLNIRAWDVVVVDSKAYVAAGTDGFYVVDVADKFDPVVLVHDTDPVDARGIAYSSGKSRIYVGDVSDDEPYAGVHVYNMSGAKTGDGSAESIEPTYKLATDGDRLYATGNLQYCDVIDISAPDVPDHIEDLSLQGYGERVTVAGELLLVATSEWGASGDDGWEAYLLHTEDCLDDEQHPLAKVVAGGGLVRGRDVQVVDDRLFYSTTYYTYVYDISDIDVPVLLLTNTDDYANADRLLIDSDGQYMYHAGTGFTIWYYNGTCTPVTAPINPNITSNTPISGEGEATLVFSGGATNSTWCHWAVSSETYGGAYTYEWPPGDPPYYSGELTVYGSVGPWPNEHDFILKFFAYNSAGHVCTNELWHATIEEPP